MKSYTSIDAYIKAAPAATQKHLKEVRAIVQKAVPTAEEGISYGMPAFSWKGKPLFYFAAMKGHLGLYPTSGPVQTCKELLADFSTSKGCVRVPYADVVPKKIILALIQARKKEIVESDL